MFNLITVFIQKNRFLVSFEKNLFFFFVKFAHSGEKLGCCSRSSPPSRALCLAVGRLESNTEVVRKSYIWDYIFKLASNFNLKVGVSPSNFFLICFNDSPSKMLKNAFYFIFKVLFVLKIFKLLS